MALYHVYSQTVADGTATSVVRPSDWNSAHSQLYQLTGNTLGNSTVGGTNVVFGADGAASIQGTGSSIIISAPASSMISGTGGVSISTNGSTIFIGSAPSTAGGQVTFSAGTSSQTLTNVVFSNSNGVSFGLNGSTITATVKTDYQSSGNYLTTARASNDAVGLNTAQSNVTWTVNSSGISIDGRNYAGTATGATNASITVNSNGVSVSVAPPGAANVNVSAGTTSNNLTNMVFSNANNVTFGMNGSTITASVVPPSGAAINFSAGTTTSALGGVTFSNANNVSFGLGTGVNAGVITATATHPTQTTQPVAVSGSNGSFQFSTLTLGNLNGVSFYTSNGSVVASYTVPTQTVQPVAVSGSNGSFAFSTLSFGQSNGATFYTTNGSVVVSYTVPSTAGHISAVNVSAGTTSNNLTALTFNNSNGVSFGLNGSVVTATVKTDYLTTARASNDAVGLNTAQSNVTWTVNSSGISLDGRNYAGTGTSATNASVTLNSNGLAISVAAPGGGAAVNFSAGTTSNNLQSVVFSNSNGMSFGLNGSTITGSYTIPASSSLSATGVVSISTNGSTISIGAPLVTGTTFNGTNVSGSMTLSTNGLRLDLSAAAGGAGGGVGTNTAATNVTWTVNTSGISLDAGGYAGIGTSATNASVTLDTNGLAISVAPPLAGGTATMWWPFNEGVNVAGQQGNGTLHFVPLPTPTPAANGVLEVDLLAIPIYFSNASNSTGTATISLYFGMYTKNDSTLSLAHSTSEAFVVPYSGNVSSGTFNGIRIYPIAWTSTFSDGRYYVAQMSRSATAGTNATFSQMLISQINSNFSGIYSQNVQASHQWPLGCGVLSASTSVLPSSVAFSQLRGTASLAARPPSFFMISGSA